MIIAARRNRCSIHSISIVFAATIQFLTINNAGLCETSTERPTLRRTELCADNIAGDRPQTPSIPGRSISAERLNSTEAINLPLSVERFDAHQEEAIYPLRQGKTFTTSRSKRVDQIAGDESAGSHKQAAPKSTVNMRVVPPLPTIRFEDKAHPFTLGIDILNLPKPLFLHLAH